MFKFVEDLRTWGLISWPGMTEQSEPVENSLELRYRIVDVDEVRQIQFDAEMAGRANTIVDHKVRRDMFLRFLDATPASVGTIAAAARETAGADDADPIPEISQSQLFAAVALRVVQDHRGLLDDADREMMFSWDTLRRLMAITGVFEATLVGYGKVSRGQAAIREGN